MIPRTHSTFGLEFLPIAQVGSGRIWHNCFCKLWIISVVELTQLLIDFHPTPGAPWLKHDVAMLPRGHLPSTTVVQAVELRLSLLLLGFAI